MMERSGRTETKEDDDGDREKTPFGALEGTRGGREKKKESNNGDAIEGERDERDEKEKECLSSIAERLERGRCVPGLPTGKQALGGKSWQVWQPAWHLAKKKNLHT